MSSGGNFLGRFGASALLPLFALFGVVMLTVQSPTAAVGAAAVLLIVAVSAPRPIRDLVAYFDSAEWPSPEARRLRGSYRRHSAADAPGRPRKARAPGSGLFT